MARKTNPQPLALSDSPSGSEKENHTTLQVAHSPLTPASPTLSPRSPFSLNSKRTQSRGGEQPSMQTADAQTSRKEPTTPTNNSTPSLHRPTASAGSAGQETPGTARGKSNKGGFFSNYKASKSHNTPRQAPDEGMSRDTDRSAMAGPVAIADNKKSGEAHLHPDLPDSGSAA